MGPTNLATLVGVGILEPPSDNPFSTAGSAVVEMLINHYDEAFAQMKKDALAEAAAAAAAAEAADAAAAAAAGSCGAPAPAPVVTVKVGDDQANKRFSVMQIEDQNRLTKLQTLRRRSFTLINPEAPPNSNVTAKPLSPLGSKPTSPTGTKPASAAPSSGASVPGPKPTTRAPRPTLPRRP